MSLLSSTRKATTFAAPLPITNTHLSHAGIALRQGQFTILAAAPGVGKTLFANNISIFTRVPSIYFSADSDEWTVKQRVCSILTGVPLAQVEDHLGDPAWESYYAEVLQRADHVDWCFNTDIEPEFIALRLLAYGELRGSWPELIVVDNLGNTVAGDSDEYAELRRVCRELQRIARTTRAHVLALHHVKGPKESGFQEIGQGDLLGNLAKIPETVIGLSRAGDDAVTVSVPKQRLGKSNFSVTVPIDYTTATIGGFR